MISVKEYNVLKLIKNGESVGNEYKNEIVSLKKDKNINYNYVGENSFALIYDGYVITPKGESALEEFEENAEQKAREIKSLSLSENANYHAKIANFLSVIAIVVSVVCAILTYFFSQSG